MTDIDPLAPAGGRGDATRERILDLTAALVARKGFSATSIEELTVGVGLTKSGFFYHFPCKLRLAHRLLERLMSRDAALLADLERAARARHAGPLLAFLGFLEALAAHADRPGGWRPGSQVAAAVYQETSYDRQIRSLVLAEAERRRGWLRAWLGEIAQARRSESVVDLNALAEVLATVLYGNPLLSGGADSGAALSSQLRLYRDWVSSLFEPAAEPQFRSAA